MKRLSYIKRRLRIYLNPTKEPKKTRVLACGTFDGLHLGHQFFLREASELGDELFIIVARDKNVQKIKYKLPKQNQQQRKEALEKIPFITKVVLGSRKNFLKIVLKIKPDVLVLGYDQELPFKKVDLKSKIPKIKVVRLKPIKPHAYKSSFLN